MRIRPGTVEDIPAVLPLVAKTIAFHEGLDDKRFAAVPNAHLRYEQWMQKMAGKDEAAFLVAEEDGAVVGFLLGIIQDEYAMYRTGRYGMIHELWVEPESRGKGVATALLEGALERFRQAGVAQARLDTAAENHAAQQLFAKVGFRPSQLEMLVLF